MDSRTSNSKPARRQLAPEYTTMPAPPQRPRLSAAWRVFLGMTRSYLRRRIRHWPRATTLRDRSQDRTAALRTSGPYRRAARCDAADDGHAAHAREPGLSAQPSREDPVCVGERRARGRTGRSRDGIRARQGYPGAVLPRPRPRTRDWAHAV